MAEIKSTEEKIIVSAMGNIENSEIKEAKFKDMSDASSWAVESINIAYGKGIVNGMGTEPLHRKAIP